LETFLFSVGNQFFLFHNFNTATNGGLKNRIFLTGCLSHLLGPVSDKNYTPLETFFFQEITKKIYFTTLNQLPGEARTRKRARVSPGCPAISSNFVELYGIS
jgi:hypothetical protein